MAGLSKQHFNAIADILKYSQKDENGFIGIECLIRDLGNYFKSQNPNFDEIRFRKDCLE